MNIKNLKYFIAVNEYGSFSKAAEHLYTIQPNISRSIKQLEEELQVQLFIRSGKVRKLTAFGEIVLSEAKEIVTRVDQLKEKISKYHLGESGCLKLGYQGDVDPEVIDNSLSSFVSRHPDIEIIFVKRSIESDLISAVYEGELDAAFTSATVGLDRESLCFQEIAYNELVLAVPTEHRFRDYDIVNVADLVGEPIIIYPRYLSPIYYDWLLKSVIVGNQNTIIHEPDLRNILLKVSLGKGISIQSTLYLRSINKKVHAVKFEYDRNQINANLILSWKSGNCNPSLPLLLQHIGDQTTSDVAGNLFIKEKHDVSDP